MTKYKKINEGILDKFIDKIFAKTAKKMRRALLPRGARCREGSRALLPRGALLREAKMSENLIFLRRKLPFLKKNFPSRGACVSVA